MAVIFTDNAIRAIRGAAAGAPEWSPPAHEALWLRGGQSLSYRATPSLRTVVDLLARNTAQLGLHLYDRLDDDSRTRDRTSPLARLIEKPNPAYSRFDLVLRTVLALGIYGETFWWKEGPVGARTALWYVSPAKLQALLHGGLDPIGRPMVAANFVRIWWPDPDDDFQACPLLETLRALLQEDREAARHRISLLRSGARWQGVVERPAGAPRWEDPQRDRFRDQLEQRFGGPAGSGKVVVFEDGMTYKPVSWSPVETESSVMRKANAEDITRSYQVPLPMAGILDHATFSNVREQHKHLYQDTLGPLNAQIEAALNLQLLDEYERFDRSYFEFNVNDKLQGSFEEQSASLGRATGRPWMTVNEARARMNMPGIAGGDALAPQPGSGTPSPPHAPSDEPIEEPAGAVH